MKRVNQNYDHFQQQLPRQPEFYGRIQYPIPGDSNFYQGRGKKHYWKKLVQVYQTDPSNPVIIPSLPESSRSVDNMGIQCRFTKEKFSITKLKSQRQHKTLQHEHPVNLTINPQQIKLLKPQLKPFLSTKAVQCDAKVSTQDRSKSGLGLNNDSESDVEKLISELAVQLKQKQCMLPKINQNRCSLSQNKRKYRVQTQPDRRPVRLRYRQISPSFASSLQNPLVDAYAYLHQYNK